MFYYPPNSCCFVLWGSFAEEVRLAGQRHKAQDLAGSGLLAPPSLAPPRPPSTPQHQAGRSRTGSHDGARPGEVHLLLYDFYQPCYCWGCQQVALGRWHGGPAQWAPARGCVLRHPESRLRGQTVREQLRMAGQGSGGPGWFPPCSPGKEAGAQHSLPFPEEAECSGRWRCWCPETPGKGCRMRMPAQYARDRGLLQPPALH